MTTSRSEIRTFANPHDAIAWEFLNQICTSVPGGDVLAKACADKPFDYALKLRSGEVIRFSSAEIIREGWIHLDVFPPAIQPENHRLPFPSDRGIDVRIDEILWVVEAPLGI